LRQARRRGERTFEDVTQQRPQFHARHLRRADELLDGVDPEGAQRAYGLDRHVELRDARWVGQCLSNIFGHTLDSPY
jgi:hypothetical protein